MTLWRESPGSAPVPHLRSHMVYVSISTQSSSMSCGTSRLMYLLRSEPVAPICHQCCHTSCTSSFPLYGIHHLCTYLRTSVSSYGLGCHSTYHLLSYLGFLVFVLLASVSSCGLWHHGARHQFCYLVYNISVLPVAPVLPYGIWHHCTNHLLRLVRPAFAVFMASMSSCWICLVVLSSWLSYDFLLFLFALVLSFRMCLFVLHLLHELWFPCTFILHQPVLSSGRRLPRTFSHTLVVRQVDIFMSSSHVSYALWVVRQLFHSFVHECCDTWYD